ncbi:MAG: P-loop NTPase fold protein [Flavobacteriaceae bacterium]|nr:P-loop NTPase fold protein [Flavobacteriaceae bacterium]
MDKKIIIEAYKDYIQRKSIIDAILINGKWGSGKTYFWKNELKKISEELGRNPIYISLNGLKEADQLDEFVSFPKNRTV